MGLHRSLGQVCGGLFGPCHRFTKRYRKNMLAVVIVYSMNQTSFYRKGNIGFNVFQRGARILNCLCPCRRSSPTLVHQSSFDCLRAELNQLHQAHHVINQIHQADLHLGLLQSDGAYDMPAHVCLDTKDMFDAGAHFGFGPVSFFLGFGQRVAPAAFFADLAVDVGVGQLVGWGELVNPNKDNNGYYVGVGSTLQSYHEALIVGLRYRSAQPTK
jgi:hypothetical protein